MKRKRKSVAQKISENLDVPLEALKKIPMIEMCGNHEMGISECHGLLEYSDRKIGLRLCEGDIEISGEGLSMQTYHDTRIVIAGKIETIVFLDGGVHDPS